MDININVTVELGDRTKQFLQTVFDYTVGTTATPDMTVGEAATATEKPKKTVRKKAKAEAAEEVKVEAAEEVKVEAAEEVKAEETEEAKAEAAEEVKVEAAEEVKAEETEEAKAETTEEAKAEAAEEAKAEAAEEVKTEETEGSGVTFEVCQDLTMAVLRADKKQTAVLKTFVRFLGGERLSDLKGEKLTAYYKKVKSIYDAQGKSQE